MSDFTKQKSYLSKNVQGKVKRHPLYFQKNIDPIILRNRDLFIVKEEGDVHYFLEDKMDEEIYFKIYSSPPVKKHNQDSSTYYVSYRPVSETQMREVSTFMKPEEVLTRFKSWASFVKEYNTLPSIYQDNIHQSYKQDFEKEFNVLLIDKDVDYAPLNYDSQIKLVQYLETIEKKLDSVSSSMHEKDIKIVKEEIEDLKAALPRVTKRQVFNKLGSIWAWLVKLSIWAELGNVVKDQSIRDIVSKAIVYILG